MRLKDKRVLVFGVSKSGISATKLLQKQKLLLYYTINTKLEVRDFEGKFDTQENFMLITGNYPKGLWMLWTLLY